MKVLLETYDFVMVQLAFDDAILLRSLSPPLVKNSCKLPKLELPKFSGNPMDWPGLWDLFQTSIHSGDGLSDVDRFNYLRKYFYGYSAACVSSLSLI